MPTSLLRLVNPVVVALLRSPAHRLLSRHLLVLSYEGRRSGRTFSLPVQYSRADGAVVVVPGWYERKRWWRNFLDGRSARLLLRGRWVPAHGTVIRFGHRDARLSDVAGGRTLDDDQPLIVFSAVVGVEPPRVDPAV